MTRPQFIDDEGVKSRLSLASALSSQRRAFVALGTGTAALAPRVTLAGRDGSVAFSYLARLSPESPAVCKLGSVNPANRISGAPTVTATIHVLNAVSGAPTATIAATELTTLRTAAASALAIEHLARRDADTLGIIGTGVQARAHALAVSQARKLREIRVAGRSLSRSREMVEDLGEQCGVPVHAVPPETAACADMVVTCTTSLEPVLETAWLRPGSTVVSIGAFEPDHVELPPSLLEHAGSVIVDEIGTSTVQSGSVVAWLKDFGADRAHRLRALGDVVTGQIAGRDDDSAIVVFLSVGLGVQDAAAAFHVLDAPE